VSIEFIGMIQTRGVSETYAAQGFVIDIDHGREPIPTTRERIARVERVAV